MASRSEQLKRTEHQQEIEFGTPIPHRNTNKYGYGNAKQYESGSGDSFKKNGNGIAYGDIENSHGYKQGQSCENRLPVNLFYSAAQYNKMLITNGKSVKKKSEPHIEGYMGNLEFINDPIFQSCQQRRQSLRHKIKPANNSERKQGNSTQDCNCCCCDQFCRLCAKQHSKGQNHNHHKPQCKTKKVTEYQIQKALQKVNSKNLKPKKKNRIKVITSEANIKSSAYDKSKQKNRTQKQKQKGISNSQKQGSSSYLSHKSFNIQNLVYKSLMQFQEEKRQSQLKKILERQMRYEKDVLMKKFDEQIRMRNRESLSKQKPKSRNKSLKQDKNTIRFEYWQAIRQKISKSLQKPISPPKKYPSTPSCHHKTTLTPQMIQTLKMKYQKQAKQRIQKQTRKKVQKKKKIEKQLKQLDRYQKKHVRSCGKKKFEPTQEMIEGAFKGIVDNAGKEGKGKGPDGREVGKDVQGKDGKGMKKNKGV